MATTKTATTRKCSSTSGTLSESVAAMTCKQCNDRGRWQPPNANGDAVDCDLCRPNGCDAAGNRLSETQLRQLSIDELIALTRSGRAPYYVRTYAAEFLGQRVAEQLSRVSAALRCAAADVDAAVREGGYLGFAATQRNAAELSDAAVRCVQDAAKRDPSSALRELCVDLLDDE